MKHIRYLKGCKDIPNFNIVEFKIMKHISNKEMACDLCELKCKRYLELYVGNGGGVIFSGKALLCESCVKRVVNLFK